MTTTTITFSGGHSGVSFVEGGFLFTLTEKGTASGDTFGGTDDLDFNYRNAILTITRVGGGQFGLTSFDLDGITPGGGGEGVGLYQTAAVGAHAIGMSDEFWAGFDNNAGFETFTESSGILSASVLAGGLTSVTITGLSRYAVNGLLLDNVVLTISDLALTGTNFADILQGVQPGTVTIDGLKGTDTVSFADSSDGVDANLATGIATGPGFSDTLVSIENLTGSDFDDILTGNGGANVLDGGDGDDSLYGGAGKDTLVGGNGDDILDGGVAADAMAGGDGDDVYYVDNATDAVTENGGEGYDTVHTSVSWVATAGSEIEKIVLDGTAGIGATGNALGQEIDGNNGANKLGDGGGAATLVGGAGNDIYVVTNGATVVQEDAAGGSDSLLTSVDIFVLPANIEKVTYTGTGSFNATGTSGAETIIGGVGDDVINGGGGADHLTGGAGADTFVLGSATAGGLVINDFTAGTDHIDLAFAAAADFITGGAGTNGVAGHATVLYDAAGGKLYWEADGLAAHKVLLASLTGHPDVHAVDIIFGP